jgi:glycosyltransferase involved in cell wall biosynthesis
VRVLLASKFLHHVGGVETYLRWQAGALSEAGYDVGLLGMTPPAGEDLMDFPDLPIFLTPARSFDRESPHRLGSAAASVYSPAVGRVFAEAVSTFRPDVIHFHSTCYQLTPAVFREARRTQAALFLTSHEYKLVCANQRLFDDRRHELCTACVGRPAAAKSLAIVRRSCIKGSLGASVLGAAEMPVAARLWRKCNGLVLAPSRFMADVLERDGRCGAVEYLEYPWSAPDFGHGNGRNSILYMARLAPEKGIRVALEAWAKASPSLPGVRFRIAGRGPEESWARDFVARSGVERVDLLGVLDAAGVAEELSRALLTVHPSIWYDNSPISVRESLCAGVPAAVSSLGGTGELVGGDRGPVIEPTDGDGWVRAMVDACSSRIAGTPRFAQALDERWYGAEDHVRRLSELYRGHASRGDASR